MAKDTKQQDKPVAGQPGTFSPKALEASATPDSENERLKARVADLEQQLADARTYRDSDVENRAEAAERALADYKASHPDVSERKDKPAESVGDIARELLTVDTARVTGLIQVEEKGEKHRVYRLFTQDGALRLDAVDNGESMPWHAARDVLERLIHNWVPPEGKR